MTSSAPPPLPPSPTFPASDAPPPPPPPTQRPPLRRSRADKVVGGVCGGLAENTGIDALLWRVGFVALVLAGGAGILIYLLLWLLMPAGPLPQAYDAPVQPAGPRSPVAGVTVAVLLIVVGVLALVARFTTASVGPVGYLGAALLVVGIGLIVGAVVGGRTSRGPLIALGVLLAFALALASVTDSWIGDPSGGFRGHDGVGDRNYRPQDVTAVQPSYGVGVGDLRLDLTDVDLADLTEPIEIELNSGAGDVDVLVPASADVQVEVDSGLGDVDVFARSADGGFFAGSGTTAWTGDGTAEFVLIIQSGLGDVTVSRG